MPTRRAPLVDVVTAIHRDREAVATVLERCCGRADAVHGDVRALLPEQDRRERLRRAAAELAGRFPDSDDRPPLYGVPVGVKDVFHVDGFTTRAGAELPPDALAGPEAAAVERLRDAGALVLGKTVTAEFAYFEPGPTRNPHDLDHTPGGSSSGSAAAVAAGICPLALGTQTAGSVLRPAAFCGVVGVKPTYGLVPMDGVIPLAPSLDTVGLFTQDVAGARLAAGVLCTDWGDEVGPGSRSTHDPAPRPTLGVPAESYLDRASNVGRAAFETQLDRLARAGYDVVHAPAIEDIDAIEKQHRTLMTAEAALVHHEWFEAYGERYAPVTAELIEEGRGTSVEALASARAGRRRLRESIESVMADRGVDLWVSPAAPGPAPHGIDRTGDPVMNAPWTYAGLPAVSVPAGDVEGLPIGLQCVGAHGDDERLLNWAEPVAEAVTV